MPQVYQNVIAELENTPLYNDTGGFQFYFDSGGLNLGFGFDVTTNTNAVAVAAFSAAGLNFNADQLDFIETTGEVPVSSYKSLTQAQLNTRSALFNLHLTALADPGNSFTITQSQAYLLLNFYLDTVASDALTTGQIL